MFVVGHDWGAIVAWHLCLFRPDKVHSLVNMGVVYNPMNPSVRPVDFFRKVYGDDYYICRIQVVYIEKSANGEVTSNDWLIVFDEICC